ncbi:hypothetical protein HYPSUDRAFT_149005, partial [Hypholoma sublateritium FD-334 SS-4]
VRRIHWLRARASAERWHEELLLVRHEMRWTVAYYEHKRSTWLAELDKWPDMAAGPAAYCCKKAAMWSGLAAFATKLFKRNGADNIV